MHRATGAIKRVRNKGVAGRASNTGRADSAGRADQAGRARSMGRTLTPMSMMVVIMMQAKGVMSGGPGTNTERDEERDAEVENPVTGQGDDG